MKTHTHLNNTDQCTLMHWHTYRHRPIMHQPKLPNESDWLRSSVSHTHTHTHAHGAARVSCLRKNFDRLGGKLWASAANWFWSHFPVLPPKLLRGGSSVNNNTNKQDLRNRLRHRLLPPLSALPSLFILSRESPKTWVKLKSSVQAENHRRRLSTDMKYIIQ